MFEIPEYFKIKASRQFGEAGPGWVAELPSIISWCIEHWALTDCQPIGNLSINLVCMARSPIYGEVVLKIQGPHSERYTEMTALELYGGKSACRCIDSDYERAAMLLERILPGNDLRSVASKNEQLAIGTDVMSRLPIRLDQTYGFPSYRDWVRRAFSLVRSQFNPSKMMKSLMAAAWELFLELDDSNQFLLHGDLHHENILQAGGGNWKVIDPQGVIGNPVFECGRFIENHVVDDDGVDHEEALKAIAHIAGCLGQSKRHVAAAFFILHLLSYCWGYEMNYPPEMIVQGVQESAIALRLVDEV